MPSTPMLTCSRHCLGLSFILIMTFVNDQPHGRPDGIGWTARELRAIFGGHFLRAASNLDQVVADASFDQFLVFRIPTFLTSCI